MQKFLCLHSQNILKKYAKKYLKASDLLTQCILVYFIFYFNILINISVINQHIYIIFFRILIVMSIFMLLLSQSLFYSSIENLLYRNNLFDLSKNSWKQSFNFKKRVGESHVLLRNLLVELFKCKHKMAFAGGSGHYFSLKLCSSVP